MARMVEVVVDSVRVSLTNQQRLVVLREVNTERYLPIWIGPFEAESITIALQEVEVARPQTHDLLKNTIHALNARLVRVEVTSLREEVFYGNLVIEINGRVIEVDSRPSDALALAVRTHVPVLVSRELMDSAGVTPDQETTDADEPPAVEDTPAESSPKQGSASSEERLSVFEDFLDQLNLDDLDSHSDKGSGETDEGDKPRSK